MAWAMPMSQLAETLAYSSRRFTGDDVDQLLALLPEELDMPKRARFKNIEILRGAAGAARNTLLKKR
jgi:hypothetical protein